MDLTFLYSSDATAAMNSTMSGVTLIFTFIVIILFAYAILKIFENSKPKVEYIVLLAFLIAIATVGRLIGIAVPGLQFATFIIILSGAIFGKETGLIVGMLTAIVSDIVMGLGFWTPYQMVAWGLIGLLSGILSSKLDNLAIRTVYGFISGFIFGWISNIMMFYYLADLNLASIIGVYVASIPVDFIHGICTAVCLLLFYGWFKKKLTRSKERYLG